MWRLTIQIEAGRWEKENGYSGGSSISRGDRDAVGGLASDFREDRHTRGEIFRCASRVEAIEQRAADALLKIKTHQRSNFKTGSQRC